MSNESEDSVIAHMDKQIVDALHEVDRAARIQSSYRSLVNPDIVEKSAETVAAIDSQAISRTIKLLTFYEAHSESIWSIIGTIQTNAEVFGGRPGESCLKIAARFIREHSEAQAKEVKSGDT